MHIFNLPDDIILNEESRNDSIIFHRYSAPAGSFYGKSILSKNAISLVINGEKTMHFAKKIVTVKDDEFHLLSAGNCLVSMNLAGKINFKSILIFFDNRTLANFHLKYGQQIAKVKTNKK